MNVLVPRWLEVQPPGSKSRPSTVRRTGVNLGMASMPVARWAESRTATKPRAGTGRGWLMLRPPGAP